MGALLVRALGLWQQPAVCAQLAWGGMAAEPHVAVGFVALSPYAIASKQVLQLLVCDLWEGKGHKTDEASSVSCGNTVACCCLQNHAV